MSLQNKGLFITGTDQGVGSTVIAAALAGISASQGLKTGVMLPVETGVAEVKKLGRDGQLLKWAAQSDLADNRICPYRFQPELEPATAASRAKTRIDFTSLVQTAQDIIENHDFTVIDGSGGLMLPLAGGLLTGDLAAMLKLPLIVVCRPDRGTINHTLMTLLVAKHMDLPVAGYVINSMPADKSYSEESVAHSLAVMTGDELLGVLDSVSGTEQKKSRLLAEQILASKTYSLIARHLPGRGVGKG